MTAFQAQADDSGRSQDRTVENALASLNHALKILDESDAPAHIGARLQEVIELVMSTSSSAGAKGSGDNTDQA